MAGSEKISKTGATGQTLNEAKKINKSLSSLGQVINALTDGKSKHVPYRDSKLTRILQESLGGNSKTCLIIACSPSVFNEAETVSTLRFGQSAKKIKNKPKINKEYSVAELKKLLDEAEAKIELKNRRIKNLEKIIKSLGGTVPQEKDDFIQRKPTEKEKPVEVDEEEKANEKIDALENQSSDEDFSDDESKAFDSRIEDSRIDDSMISSSRIGDSMIGDSMIGDSIMGDSMMGDSMMGESMMGDESMTNVGDITFDATSKNSQSKPTHKPKQKSRMEEIDETFARLQKEVEAEKHDAETMTEQPTLVNVKTNTNSTADH